MKQRVHYQQAYGVEGYELEINLDYHRPLTENDRRAILRSAEDMLRSMHVETRKTDPKYQAMSAENHEKIRKAFEDAGIQPIFMKPIDNRYCGPACCPHLPWFVVTTFFGNVTIGWRKRVIEIRWDDSLVPESAQDLFPNEDVTKDGKLIHAWGYEKATEYLKRLAQRGKEITG